MFRQALERLYQKLSHRKASQPWKKKPVRLEIETLELRWLPASFSLSSSSYSVYENAGKLTVTVNLDVPAPSNTWVYLSVDSSYSPGSPAEEGTDFRFPDAFPYTGRVFFTQGTYSKTYDIFITDDDLSESTESFRIQLEDPNGTWMDNPITIGSPDKAVVSITNVTPSTWNLSVQPTRLTDNQQGYWETFGRIQFSPSDGQFKTMVPIQVGHAWNTSLDAWGRQAPPSSLVYTPTGADGRPFAEVILTSASETPWKIWWDDVLDDSPGSQNNRVLTIEHDGTGTDAEVITWSSTYYAQFLTRGDIIRTVTGYTLAPGSGTAIAPGWGISGVDRLVSTSEGMLWVFGSGGAQLFTGSGPTYTSPANNFGTLVRNGGGDYTYTAQNQVDWNFNSSGQITSIVDPHGLTRTFTYSSGLLSKIQDPDLRITTFQYDSGKLARIIQPGGHTVTLTMDGTSGDLTSILMPDGRSFTYAYDSDHFLTEESYGDNIQRGLYSYSYDASSKALSGILFNNADRTAGISLQSVRAQVFGGTATESNLKAVIIDASSYKTTLTLDRGGRVQSQQNKWGGSVQSWSYNQHGQLISSKDAIWQTTTYTYDGNHDLIEILRPDGSRFTFQYDSTYHQVTRAQDSLNQITTFTYNAYGDLTSIKDPLLRLTTFTWSNGLLQSMTDPLNRTTQLQYTSGRQLQVVVDALSQRTTYAYDAAGFQTSLVNARGQTTGWTVDSLGRVLTETDALGAKVTYTYDSFGLLAYTNDKGVRDIFTTYDLFLGVLVNWEVHTPGGYDLQRKITYQYNSLGWLTTSTDALNHTITYTYNAAGWPVTKTDPLNRTTTYSYDAVGQLISVKDPRGNITSYSYDSRGWLQSQIDALYGTTYYSFDTEGNLLTLTNPLGARTTHTYDAAGRLIKSVNPLSQTTTFVYDAADNLIVTQYPQGTLARPIASLFPWFS